MPEYKPVPVTVAVAIAENFDKDVVVVMCIDRTCNKTHFTTYGKSPADKIDAAKFGELISQGLGCRGPLEQFEDFRNVPAAERAAENLALKKAVAWFVSKYEGDSGAGANHWGQFPEFREALRLIGRAQDAAELEAANNG